jgi:hypothetical protein
VLAAGLMGLAMAASSGCTRTDDGSVTMADPLHVGRYLRREPSPPATPPVQSGLQVFPVSPTAQSVRTAPVYRTASLRKGKRRATVQAAQQQPAGPLSCHDAVTSGGRVHVVCE